MILGILLAAGTGSRFGGGNKLLASLDGDPVVAHSARCLTGSALDAAVAVVGHDRQRVERALPDDIAAVANPDYRAGQSTSIRRGVAAARDRGAEAAVFALGDMPSVAVETVDALLDAYGEEGARVVAPRRDGRRGNPVLFDSRYFDALAGVSGDRGGRALLESESVTLVDVDDPGIHRDVDTGADLQALQDESDAAPGRG